MIIDGCHVMPFCTTQPALPLIPNTTTLAHGLPLQHITEPNYVVLANTEAAGLLTQVMTAIAGQLECDDPECAHECVVELSANGGYTLVRPACQLNERPGLWRFEGIDACAAYLKSQYYRALVSGLPMWDQLLGIICRFHDIKCNKQKLKDLGLSADSERLARGDKSLRILLGARSREDLDARLLVFRVHVLPTLFDDVAKQEEYYQYVLKTRFAPDGHAAFLPHDRKARTHAAYGAYDAPLASRYNMNLEARVGAAQQIETKS